MKTKLSVLLGAAIVARCADLSGADLPSVEQRLRSLETTIVVLQQENTALRQQIGWDEKAAPSVLVRSAGRESSFRLGGVVQGQGEFGGAADVRYVGVRDRFFLRRARLAATSTFAEHFDFKMEADFGAGATGERTGITTQITDVYVNWSRSPAANVRLGQFKSPFGYEQLIADPKLLTIERSLANDRLTDGRQIGVGVSGSFARDQLTYSVGAFNGSGVNSSANDNSRFLWAGRLAALIFAGPWGGEKTSLTIGVDGLATHDSSVTKTGFGLDSIPGGAIDNIFSGRRTALGFDAQLRMGRGGLDAEYLRAEFHPTNRLPFTPVTADGWSVLASWFVVPKTVQAIARYETFDPNTRLDANEYRLWTLGLVWLLKGDDIKFAFNYLIGDPAGSTTRQDRLLTRVQLVF